jgi:UDP-N-acetylglucosamine--N-acetylmuramyl-(pentapeptide) pyrophosphoryl-undecaprenol N-acetylglucosamine transferase
LNIIIASGGTGGHIYPGIALAEKFETKGYNITFFISNNFISLEILRNSKFKYVKFNVPKRFKKKSFISYINNNSILLFTMTSIFFKSIIQILKIKPLFVIGTGGNITVPILFAAKILRIKIFIHEQNVVPGRANLLLNRIVDKTFTSFEISGRYFKNKNIIFVMYPIRKNILLIAQKLKQKNNIFTILTFGGSLGATKLNYIACKALLELSFKGIKIIHITGNNDYITVKEQIKNNVNYSVFRYMHNIANAYVMSNIIICRSGASTIFELKIFNKPAILIPYPYATNNHQYHNAKIIEKHKKIIIIDERNLTKKKLIETVYTLKRNILEI